MNDDADEILSLRVMALNGSETAAVLLLRGGNGPAPGSIPLVYIAGPYTAEDGWKVEQNVRRAEEVAYQIAGLGMMPVCPHSNLRYPSRKVAAFLYSGTLELMRRCDAVFLLDGWERSRGAVGEVEEARRMGLPVFDRMSSLLVWRTERAGA